MACVALKSNLQYCRNWSTLDSCYCHAHQTLTPETFKERWIQKYILYKGFPYYTLFTSGKKEKILADLKAGHVVLTQQDILKIPVKEGYVDTYLLLLENNYAQSGDHPNLERCGLLLYQVILRSFPNGEYGDIVILKQAIEKYLIAYSGDTLYRFFLFIGVFAPGRQLFQAQMRNLVPSLLDSQAAKELSWCSFDHLDSIRKVWESARQDHPMMRCLVERWLPDIKELYQTEKQIQRMKMDHCKEELMMVCWHPDRVSKLLEAGIDPEDM